MTKDIMVVALSYNINMTITCVQLHVYIIIRCYDVSHGDLMQKCIVVNSLLELYNLIIYKVAKGDLKIAAP